MRYVSHYLSPLGGITLAGDGETLTGLWFDNQKYFGRGLDSSAAEAELPVFARTKHWLDTYFGGRDPDFTPPLEAAGTPFQRSVWAVLRQIPFGETVTYGEVAREIARIRGSSQTSARAVGGAVGRNPISLLIPCHRVVGAGGLTGYAGGLDKKKWLLAMEQGTGRAKIPPRGD